MKKKFTERYIIIALFFITLLFFSVANEQSRQTEQLWKSAQPAVLLEIEAGDNPNNLSEFSFEDQSPVYLSY